MCSSVHPITRLLWKANHHGDPVEFEGSKVFISKGMLEPGDVYVAGRNVAVIMGEVKEVENGYVYATDLLIYPYNVDECYKIIRIE